MATVPVQPSKPRGHWAPGAIAAALVVLALGASYAPIFANLVDQWNSDPNNTYGFLVIPIALVILWERRGLFDRSQLAPKGWAFLPLVALLGLRYLLFEWNEKYVEAATIPAVLGLLGLALGGWHLIRVAFPALVFLMFVSSINF